MNLIKRLEKIEGKILLIFNHGLGDFINFLPIYFELKKRCGSKLVLGCNHKRGFRDILPEVHYIEEENFDKSGYSFIYRVHYSDPNASKETIEESTLASKAYLCATVEFGLTDFIWKPFNLTTKKEEKSNRIGLHFFGHTQEKTKFCPVKEAMDIWTDILSFGLEPFEIHMRPKIKDEYFLSDTFDYFPLATKETSIRFEEPSIKRMIMEISRCSLFVGVDAGPLYLAVSILGKDRVIGLENEKHINAFLPVHINTINVKNYNHGDIKKLIWRMLYERKN